MPKNSATAAGVIEMPFYPALTDYFGNALTSGDEEDITIVFGVYQGMVKSGMSAELLHNCLLNDRLTELVHAKHKHRTGYYYRGFCYKMLDLSDRHPLVLFHMSSGCRSTQMITVHHVMLADILH